MKFFKNHNIIDIMGIIDKDRILKNADEALDVKPRFITHYPVPMSEGGVHDYYSNGDYWWPNPDTPDGLPYIRRDGESNPASFMHHRNILREMRTNVAHLAAAYTVTGDEKYARKAAEFLKGFFIDKDTKMNPNLLYSQAIPGICPGRGIGVIDTLHLVEVPVAVSALGSSSYITEHLLNGLKEWFAEYLEWMTTHKYGIDEMNENNNHSICWHVQAASFALFTSNMEIAEFCREQYKNVLLLGQMGPDGSFPAELARTKPYGYSIFVLDNLITLCHMLSTRENNLWQFELMDGRGVKKGMEFLYPYLVNKSSWPYKKDIQHFEDWPVAMASFLFAGIGLKERKYIELWKRLEQAPANKEIRRNMNIRQPLLWLL